MAKKIFIILAVIVLLIFCLDVLTSFKFTLHLLQAFDLRRQEFTKLYQYETFLSQLQNAETGQLEYVLTGSASALELYQSAVQSIQSSEMQDFIASEKKSSDPKTAERVATLEELKDNRLEELKSIVNNRTNFGFHDAQKDVLLHNKKKTVEKMRLLLHSIQEEEQNNLESLEKEIKQATRDTLFQLLFSNTVAAILLALCLVYIYRNTQQLAKNKKELLQMMKEQSENLAMRQAILNSTNSAVISTDKQGVITLFNPAAEKMLGYTSEEMIGKQTPEVFHDKKEMEERALTLFKQLHKKVNPDMQVFTALAQQDIPDTNEWTLIRKDGTRVPVQLCVTVIKDAHNEIVGFLGVLSDLTERKHLEHLQEELIAITGNELRELITAVKGSFDLLSLQEKSLSDQAKHLLEIGKKNCEFLVNLTNNMLEMQKLETGKIDFNFKNIDLASFLIQAIKVNATAAQQARHPIIYQSTMPHCHIEADENQLMQAVNHLISTLIKSSSGEGKIEVSAQQRGSKVRIEIKDQDLLNHSSLKNLSDLDLHPSITNSSKRENSLGLRIAKLIVEKHDGTLGFQKIPNGISYWFELPIQET